MKARTKTVVELELTGEEVREIKKQARDVSGFVRRAFKIFLAEGVKHRRHKKISAAV